MEEEKRRPQRLQSREWFLKALRNMMQEKDFSDITITELSEEAGLDRKTFYRNFKSKEDILMMKIDEACDKYIAELKKHTTLTSFIIAKVYFDICLEYSDFIGLLHQHRLSMLVLSQLDKYLPMMENIFLEQLAYHRKSDYEMYYEAGGFWNVTVHWIHNGAKETPKEMAEIISDNMRSYG